MSSQALPTIAPVPNLDVTKAFPRKDQQDYITALLNDIISLRNTVDALVTALNTHTHKCVAAGSISSKMDSSTQSTTPTAALSLTGPSTHLVNK